MSFYIPNDWIKDTKNKETVFQILNKYFYSDLQLSGNENYKKAKEELKRIGETIIIEKIEDGTILVY